MSSFLVLCFNSISLFSAAKSETDPMNAYLSQNKPLVVLMPDAQDDLFVSQSEAFAGRCRPHEPRHGDH